MCNGALNSYNKMNVSVGSKSSATPRQHRKYKNPITHNHRRRYKLPGTPVSNWKFDENHRGASSAAAVSARKLAAGLWQLRLLAEPHAEAAGHVNVMPPLHRTSRAFGISNPSHKLESSSLYSKPTAKGATKSDPGCLKTSTEANCIYSRVKLLEDRYNTVSIVSDLQAELEHARLRINKLEDEHQSSKMKVDHLMRNLGEDLWIKREYHKMFAVTHELKDELRKERKIRKKIEILNSKLAEELAAAKSSAEKVTQDYEQEKRARELMDEVCNELATKIGEDKVKLEALTRETMKIREEVEEEREMLQMAEVWREERLQMKLVDAKLALEYKYCQMNNLVADLESFLRSRTANVDMIDLRKAELIRNAVKSVNIQDIKEFEYLTSTSDATCTIFDENRQGEANEKEKEPLINYSPISDASNHHTVSPQVNGININCRLNHSNGVLESASHSGDQGSRCSFEGSVNFNRYKIASRSKTECNENAGPESGITEIGEECSISGEQPKQKTSSVSKHRKSLSSSFETRKMTADKSDGSLSNETVSSMLTTSPHRKSVDSALRQQDSVTKLVNPHITRGMKGSIEWPRGIRKSILKAKLLKPMMESEKTRLRAMF